MFAIESPYFACTPPFLTGFDSSPTSHSIKVQELTDVSADDFSDSLIEFNAIVISWLKRIDLSYLIQ